MHKQTAVVAIGLAVMSAPALGALTTDSLVLNHDAGVAETTFPAEWDSTTDPGNRALAWQMQDRTVTFDPNPTTNLPGVGGAYTFPGIEGDTLPELDHHTPAAGGVTQDFSNFAGDGVNATFEVWAKPDNLDDQDILFETGAQIRGVGLAMNGSELMLGLNSATGDAPEGLASADVAGQMPTDEFSQVAGSVSFDPDAGENGVYSLALYLNGDQIATDTIEFGPNDSPGFDGLSDSGLGIVDSTSGNQPFWETIEGFEATPGVNAFEGQISHFRYYSDILTSGEIEANFESVIPEPASLALMGVGGVLMLPRRRRR